MQAITREELNAFLKAQNIEQMEMEFSLLKPSQFDISKGVREGIRYPPYEEMNPVVFKTDAEYELRLIVRVKGE